MGTVYATLEDVRVLGRDLTAKEQEKVPSLLEIASALLRSEGKKRGYDPDGIINSDEDKALIAKILTVNCVVRALNSSADTTPAVTQESQSALGYSASLTYLNAGQDVYFLKNELRQLGFIRQKYGVMEVYDYAADKGDDDPSGG